jgi:ATP/maltotriose-dependent transcriptional regulator MalT
MLQFSEEDEPMTAAALTKEANRLLREAGVNEDYPHLTTRAWRRIERLEVNLSGLEHATVEILKADPADRCLIDTLMEVIAGLGLSARDKAILELVAQSANKTDIARRLQIHRHTVTRHLERIRDEVRQSDNPYAGWFLCYLETVLCRHLFEDNPS